MPITPSGFGAFKGALGATARTNKFGGAFASPNGFGAAAPASATVNDPRAGARGSTSAGAFQPAGQGSGGGYNPLDNQNRYGNYATLDQSDEPAETQPNQQYNPWDEFQKAGKDRYAAGQPFRNQQQQPAGQRPSREGQMATQRGGAYYDPNGGVDGGNYNGGNGMAFGLQTPDGQGEQQSDQPYNPWRGGQDSPPQGGGQGEQQQPPPYDPYGGGQQGGTTGYAAMGPDGQGLGNGFDMNDYGPDNPPPPSFAPPPNQQQEGPFVRGQGQGGPLAPYDWSGGQPPYNQQFGGMLVPQGTPGAGAINPFRRSDMRLKSNIVRVGTHPLGVGVYDYDIDGHRERGVMAQELLHVLPSAVRVGGDGYLMVNYEVL